MMTPLRPRHTSLIVYTCLLAVTIAGMHFIRRCSGGSDYEKRILRVAIVNSPLSYHLEGDSIDGINYVMLKNFANANGMNLSFSPVLDIDDAFSGLQSGRYDILASYPVEPQLSDRFSTTDPVYIDRLTLLTRCDRNEADVPVTNLDIDTINILKNSPARIEIAKLSKRLSRQIAVNEHVQFSNSYILNNLGKPGFRFAIVSSTDWPDDTGNDINIRSGPGFSQFHVWYVRKEDHPLSHKLDNWLDSFIKTDRYRQLLERHNTISPY